MATPVNPLHRITRDTSPGTSVVTLTTVQRAPWKATRYADPGYRRRRQI